MEIINNIIRAIGETATNIISTVSGFCPFSAFQNALENDLLAMINYFIPLSEMIVILEGWGVAIIGYYALSILLRWIKVVR